MYGYVTICVYIFICMKMHVSIYIDIHAYVCAYFNVICPVEYQSSDIHLSLDSMLPYPCT